MALAERLLAAAFGDDARRSPHLRLRGDGCLMEGISHEAISLAGHLQPQQADRAVGRQLDLDRRRRPASRSPTTSSRASRAHGWAAERIDGHDPDAIAAAIEPRAGTATGRRLIACRTIIAFGAPTKAGTAAAHGAPLGAEEIAGARERLGWEYPPFVVPDDVRAEWRAAGARGAARRAGLGAAARRGRRRSSAAEFVRRQSGRAAGRARRARSPRSATNSRAETPSSRRGKPPARCSTRWSPAVPELVGGSADLTPLEQHQGQGPEGGHAAAISPAATSITACASTAWRRR